MLLYPIVPLMAYLCLLWKHPNDLSRRREKKDFQESATLAAVAHSIAGGIESPIQFILQV